MTPRVLAVIDTLGGGGTERSLAELLPHLAERGVDVSVTTLRAASEGGLESSLRSAGWDIRRLDQHRRVRSFRALLDEIRPDVVHSMLFEANMVTRIGTIGTRTRLLTSLVSTSYAPARLATPGVHRSKLRLVQTLDLVSGRLRVDRFHAVSETVKASAVRDLRIPAEKIVVVRRGRRDLRSRLDPGAGARLRHQLGIPRDASVVLAVGRHEVAKDHRTLLIAIEPLLARIPDLHLLLAGREGAASSGISDQVGRSEHPERIRVLGHRDDIAQLLDAADLLVLTSRYEGLPGVLIEAMAMGVPVVASDIPAVHEVVEPDETALLAQPGLPDRFTGTIARLLDDPTLRSRLGARGRLVFEERFEIGVAADRMTALYRSLCSGRDPG